MTKMPIVDDVVRGSAWQEHAACLGMATNLFFADPTHIRKLEYAKSICAGCPVSDPCLESELAIEGKAGPASRYGVRGGLTPEERHALARARSR